MQSDQLREIASWRIATEVVRQFPKSLRLYETHPGGGQYDCLSLHNHRGVHLADFNRQGTFHAFHDMEGRNLSDPCWKIWEEMGRNTDMKAILLRIDQYLGITKPKKLPASNPRTITYRFIAMFLCHACFGVHSWRCRSGMCDTSGYGGGVAEKMFAKFPEAKKRLEIRLKGETHSYEPSYRFWFLCRDEEPLVCLEDVGHAWLPGKKKTILLAELYAKHHRVWPVIHAVAGDLLP
jgi:hypothetical protein